MSTYAGLLTDPPRFPSGRAIPNALVVLRVPGTTDQPTYYSDRLKSQVRLSSTIKTDARGNLQAWVEPGIYEYWYNDEFLELTAIIEDNDEDNVTTAQAIQSALNAALSSYYGKSEIDGKLLAITSATLLSGDGAPSDDIGTLKSFYIDRTAQVLYGPKGTTTWPSVTTPLRGLPGAKGDPGISPFVFRGPWSSTTAYLANDQVSRNGLLWVAAVTSTNVVPGTDGGVWIQATVAGPPGASGALPLSQQLAMWTAGECYQLTGDLTYSSTSPDVVTSASVRWPDNSVGTYTATVDATWGTWASYQVTHDLSGGIVKQNAITRDSQGRVTHIDALLITNVSSQDAFLTAYTGGY